MKEQAKFGEYTVIRHDDNKIEVQKGGEAVSNAMAGMCEISEQVGFTIEEKWNTQQTGAKLIQHLNANANTDTAADEGAFVIPEGTTEIEERAFFGCKSLTSIVIPDSVTEIGKGAFEGCTSLTSIVIPDSVTEIGGGAFVGCKSLTSVVISDSVTEIRDVTFSACKSLTSIVIPDSVTEIGMLAFLGCKSLTSVVIPDSVTEIGSSAFKDCKSLTEIVTSIGNGEKLKEVINENYNEEAAELVVEK